jgi:hypothetical protein
VGKEVGGAVSKYFETGTGLGHDRLYRAVIEQRRRKIGRDPFHEYTDSTFCYSAWQDLASQRPFFDRKGLPSSHRYSDIIRHLLFYPSRALIIGGKPRHLNPARLIVYAYPVLLFNSLNYPLQLHW